MKLLDLVGGLSMLLFRIVLLIGMGYVTILLLKKVLEWVR